MTAQKMTFSTSADLVKFTEEILNRKLHFLCREACASVIVVNFDIINIYVVPFMLNRVFIGNILLLS